MVANVAVSYAALRTPPVASAVVSYGALRTPKMPTAVVSYAALRTPGISQGVVSYAGLRTPINVITGPPAVVVLHAALHLPIEGTNTYGRANGRWAPIRVSGP